MAEEIVTRDEHGRILPGHSGNPSGRPKEFAEFKQWLKERALDKAKEALLACLDSPDEKVRLMATKEVFDRTFGKAPQAITGEDGKPLSFGVILMPPEKP